MRAMKRAPVRFFGQKLENFLGFIAVLHSRKIQPRHPMNNKTLPFCALFLSVIACGGDSKSSSTVDTGISGDAVGSGCLAGEKQEIHLVTEDGIDLIADLYPAQNHEGGKSVILLHMIPPSNSKANYPESFAKEFQDLGYTVINVNRRGAPGSGGNASDAYNGPLGKLDAKAAYEYLKQECGVGSYAMIGASNGTTTMIDFAVFAGQTEGIDSPTALVALSAGTYTEKQNSVVKSKSILPSRAFFAYPASEADWNEGIAPAFGDWKFSEYDPGAHGTRLFESNPEIVSTIVQFIESD